LKRAASVSPLNRSENKRVQKERGEFIKENFIMKRTRILGFLFIFALTAFGFSAIQAQALKFRTWKITQSQSGGFAGIQKTFALDSEGNLTRTTKGRENSEQIDSAKVAEIGRLVARLKLPGTKLKTVGGKGIYDGIYTGFVINLDGKDYKVEGTSFDNAKYLALSAKQKATLEKLKAKLNELGGLSESKE
jgi:hypothetical protein